MDALSIINPFIKFDLNCDPRSLNQPNFGNWDGFVETGLERNRAHLVAARFGLNAFTDGTYGYTLISEDPGLVRSRGKLNMTIGTCLKICNTNNFAYAGLTT